MDEKVKQEKAMHWVRHLVLKLVAAAAVARSGFPLILLVATRGSADDDVEVTFVLVVRLPGVDGCNPLTVECRFANCGFTGELPETSRLRTKVPFFMLVAGGSGRGLPVDGSGPVATRLPGELVAVYVLAREGNLTPVMNSCRRAS